MAIRHWLQLSLTEGIGPILSRRLIDLAGSIDAACSAPLSLLRQVEGIGSAKASAIHHALKESASAVDAEIDRAAQLGIALICPDDASYPLLLKQIHDPPGVLYVKGSLEARDLQAVAIVGSRRCSFYGREQAERFGALLAGAGVTVVSGGARGIDSAAHRGTLSHPQGRTLAVLGSGIDVPYPSENKSLFDQIAERGAVLSEYPLGTPPLAENFPKRNRIVSGMSRAVLVIEADIKSGALITARLAGEDQGRPVLALPGRVDNAMSAGPHQLIRDGATLITNLDDILQSLGPLPDIASDAFPIPTLEDVESPQSPAPPSPVVQAEGNQLQILDALDGQPMSVDQIIDRTSLDAATVLRELTLMSLKGMIKRTDGQTYVRRN